MRRGGEDATARCVEVGEHVGGAVAVGMDPRLRVDAHLDRHQCGCGRIAGREVGPPQVIAWRRALRRRDRQPATVAAHGDVVVVGDHLPGAEHLDVRRLGVGADAVQQHAPVVLRLTVGHERRVQPAHVVEAARVAEPGHRAVAGAVDRGLDHRHVIDPCHPQRRLLRATVRQLVGEQGAVGGGLPGVERGEALGVDHHGVEQHALAAVRVDGEEHGMLLVAGTAQEEAPGPAPDGRGHTARREQLGHAPAPMRTGRPRRRGVGEQ